MASEQLEDVLNDYVASIETPTHDALQEWVKNFPQYETDLTEFTIAWMLMEALPPMTKPTHGGKRQGAGAKPKPLKLRIIKIACTQEELQQILSTIKDTRKRALILLDHKETK